MPCHHLLLQYSLDASVPALTGFKVLSMLQVNYKNVMKQYGLGPNGGILTSLNLFATRFDQVIRDQTMHSFQADVCLTCHVLSWPG